MALVIYSAFKRRSTNDKISFQQGEKNHHVDE